MDYEIFSKALDKIEKERTVIINLYMQLIAAKDNIINAKNIAIDSLNKEIERLNSEINIKNNTINFLEDERDKLQ
jgi:hypothetical protein